MDLDLTNKNGRQIDKQGKIRKLLNTKKKSRYNENLGSTD